MNSLEGCVKGSEENRMDRCQGRGRLSTPPPELPKKGISEMLRRLGVFAFAWMFIASATVWGRPEKTAPVFRTFQAFKGFFCCEVPAGEWELQSDEELDESGEYEMKLMNGSMLIDVIYYTPQQLSFAGHRDFIERNTRNVLGETRNARETYGPAEQVEDHGIKAFRIERRRLVYLHLESKSDESRDLKEKLYVVPGESGFFVLEFSAPAALYDEHLPTFEKVFSTFRPGKPGMKCDH